MSRQLLMCIRSVAIHGQVIAEKGKKYTYRDSTECSCGKKMVSVEEVGHGKLHPCFPGDSWLPTECFIPLNDPKLDEAPEKYGERTPIRSPVIMPETVT